MATTGLARTQDGPLGEPSIIRKEDMMAGMMGASTGLVDNGTSLIARAEALNAFMKMQPAANQARAVSTAPPPPDSPTLETHGCLCFGTRRPPVQHLPTSRPRREYYPDNLSVQPARHPWTPHMEWLIIACIDFLEHNGLDERNLFAVSAVEDLVRDMAVDIGTHLPKSTDPHVASGVIKAQIRHANEPLVSKDCLRAYIEAQSEQGAAPANAIPTSYRDSHLAKTVDQMERTTSLQRAYILARFMRLLGRVSANEAASKMNAHCLAKCVAPSMLHWDPNSGFALLMLGKITGYVKSMIEEARTFDENLCQKISELDTRVQ